MFLFICLCFSAFVAVSANNVIPVQTYPIYQQNGFMNPLTNQPINIQPYTTSITTQNQLQQLNISPSSIKQALLNKLLAGSSGQMILNPSAQSYGTNLCNVPNDQIPRNFVRNNIVVPAEHWENRINDNNVKTSRDPKFRVRPNRSNNKKNKSKRSQNDGKAFDDDCQKHTVNEINKTQKKSNRRKNVQVPKQTSISETDRTRIKTTRNTSKKAKEQITENPIDKNSEQSAKLRRRCKKPKTNKDNAKNKLKEKENIDLDITHDGMDIEYRKTRDSKQEVNDIIKSYPNTPQEITNHFLTNLNQLNNPLMSNWFAHYEKLYQSLLSSQPIVVTESLPKRRRKNKNKKNKKKKNVQNRNPTVNTKNVKSNKLDTELINKELYSNPIVESFKTFETNDKNMKYTSNEIFQDGYTLNEFGDNYDPGYYEGYIDDYYPMFTDSAAYTANNKEIILKNLNDHKYFYVTDKIETNIPKKQQKSSYDVAESTPNDYEIFKHTYDEVEKESINDIYKQNFEKEIDEEIRFQSPPFLESPDFKTRQIEKSEIQSTQAFDDKKGRYVGDKSFSAKTANFNGAKKNGIKPQPKDIETLYAKSKVVAYGPVYIPGEDTSTASTIAYPWNDHDFTIDSYQSGGTTYVIAKSVDDKEEYK